MSAWLYTSSSTQELGPVYCTGNHVLTNAARTGHYLWYFALKEKVMTVNVCLASREQLTKEYYSTETKCIHRGDESHWHSAGGHLHESPLKALLKDADNLKPASGIHILRRHDAKNEGAGEAGGGCCPRRRDVTVVRDERSVNKKRILNICGATPFVSQNHVLTTMAI